MRGKLMLLWDDDGRLIDSADVELPGGCDLSFFASKRR